MVVSTGLIIGLKMASGFLRSMKNSQQYKVMAEEELQNAELLRQNAYITRITGAKNEDISRIKNRAFIASNRAIAGEAGIGESPTTMTNLAYSTQVLEQNVLNDRYLVESEAENYLYQARIKKENARMLEKKYKNSFGSSLLSSVVDVF